MALRVGTMHRRRDTKEEEEEAKTCGDDPVEGEPSVAE